MFFVGHSPQGAIESERHDAVSVWSGPQLAQLAVRAGLFDWVIKRFA